MANATAERLSIRNEQQETAAYERWIQAELSGDSRLTALRVLYNDIRDRGEVDAETWDYFDLQEMTGGAESMDTQHITTLEGRYDPATDEIVAAIAGGERVTYDSFTVSGLQRALERAAQTPNFAFQIDRDQIYHDNYHGVVKDMWRGQTDYDTVMYVSTFPQDIIDTLGERGRMIIKDLAYDDEGQKGFIYGFRKSSDGNMEFFAIRLGSATPEHMAAYLQKQGRTAEELKGVDSHHYGQFVLLQTTAGMSIEELARHQATLFDQGVTELTGKRHYFGRDQSGADAYDLFKQAPKLWQAYRQYHRLLATHFAGLPLHDDLYAYLVSAQESMGAHVLESHELARLEAQLEQQHITADMALACKKLMTYAQYATLNRMLDEYHHTGRVVDLEGENLMQAYGATAGGDGGSAAARGETFNDCDMVYGQAASTAATEMAERLSITLEEALRRLTQKSERWSRGDCRNCERDTQIWKEHDGGCNVCQKCANEHTLFGERGLERERRRARAEREVEVRLPALDAEAEEYLVTPQKDEPALGTTRYVNGQQQLFTRRITFGGAENAWVDTTTGHVADE